MAKINVKSIIISKYSIILYGLILLYILIQLVTDHINHELISIVFICILVPFTFMKILSDIDSNKSNVARIIVKKVIFMAIIAILLAIFDFYF